MRSYRIVLEYTVNDERQQEPLTWDWHVLLAEREDETISCVSAEPIEVPAGHIEYFKVQDAITWENND